MSITGSCNLPVVIVLNILFCDANHVTLYIVIFNCYSNFTYVTIIFIDPKICCKYISSSIFIHTHILFYIHTLVLTNTIYQMYI